MSTRSLKILFVLIAIALTVLLFTWPSGDARLTLSTSMDVGDVDVNIKAKVKASDLATTAATIMEKPRFFGEDEEDRKWSLQADRAIQSAESDADKIQLDEIEASSTLKNGSSVFLKATKGEFSTKTQAVSLAEGVELQGLGYTLKTDSVSGNIREQNLSAPSKVEIKGVQGEIKAGSFEMKGLNEHLRLDEGVKMRFYPKGSKKEGDKS